MVFIGLIRLPALLLGIIRLITCGTRMGISPGRVLTGPAPCKSHQSARSGASRLSRLRSAALRLRQSPAGLIARRHNPDRPHRHRNARMMRPCLPTSTDLPAERPHDHRCPAALIPAQREPIFPFLPRPQTPAGCLGTGESVMRRGWRLRQGAAGCRCLRHGPPPHHRDAAIPADCGRPRRLRACLMR